MKIYTKTGDLGTTHLVDGRECSKANLRVETYGTVDELNSVLGMTLSQLKIQPAEPLKALSEQIERIQNQLFNIGSHLACEKEEVRARLPAFEENWVMELEKSIDLMTEGLPPLVNFILPGGAASASCCHLARTTCRRAERMVVRLIEAGQSEPENLRALKYLNRLSDYLFVAARFINHSLGVPDQIWKK